MSKLRRRDAGVSIWRDAITGRVLHIVGTFRCTHCQMHVDSEPDVMRTRGWCQSCDGPTCGKPTCGVCVHWEQRLENEEAGRDELYKPIMGTVPLMPTFNLIAPEVLTRAPDPSEVGGFSHSPDGFNLGPAGGEERGAAVHGVRPEARDSTPAECACL